MLRMNHEVPPDMPFDDVQTPAQYDLEPQPMAALPPQQGTVVHRAICKQCAYDLSGLNSDGNCPECGLPVERSLTEDLLEFSSSAYLESLHKGVVLILAAIIVKLIVAIGGIIIGIVLGINQIDPTLFYQLNYGLGFIASLMLALGWWLFSAPDPAFTGRLDGSKARQIVRITTVTVAGISLVLVPMQFMSVNSMNGPLTAIVVVLSMISMIAWATGFFAAMLYIRWLAPRIPDERSFDRAKTLMWAGPLLFTVGSLCIGIGPLIALVLYWNMLDWIRKDLKSIRREQSS